MAERYPAPVVTRFRQPRFVQTSDSPPAVAAGAHGGELPGKPLSAPEILRALSLPRRSANAAFLAEQALNEALGRLTGGSCPG